MHNTWPNKNYKSYIDNVNPNIINTNVRKYGMTFDTKNIIIKIYSPTTI